MSEPTGLPAPAPWQIARQGSREGALPPCVVDANGFPILDDSQDTSRARPMEERLANLRYAAAAPDLVAALQAMGEHLFADVDGEQDAAAEGEWCHRLYSQWKAALAKAKEEAVPDLQPGLYRVTTGPLAGALVHYHFTNSSGNADCRFAEDFGLHRAGEIVVVPPANLTTEEPHAQA